MTAAAVAGVTMLGGGFFQQNLLPAQAAGEPMELTKLTVNSPFATMGSNTSGLTVVGEYKINDNNGGTGAVATIVLDTGKADYTAKSGTTFFAGRHYFEACPEVTKTAAMGDVTCDGAGTDTMTVTIPFIGGVWAETGRFTLVFPFDHTTFDGRVADGTTLGNLDVSIAKDGGATSEQMQAVVSSATAKIGIQTAAWNGLNSQMLLGNTGTLALYVNLQSGAIPVSSYPQSTGWSLEPGSTVTIQMGYHVGAVVSGINGTGSDDHNGTITWITAPVADDGSLVGAEYVSGGNPPYYRVGAKYATFQFPAGTFSDGEKVQLTYTASYTLWGGVDKQVSGSTSITLTAPSTTPHVGGFTEGVDSGNVIVSVDQPDNSSANTYAGHLQYIISNGEYNGAYSPIPDMVFTWQNSSDYRKARLSEVGLASLGTTAGKAELVLYIYNSNGTPAIPATVIQYVNTPGAGTNYVDVTGLYNAADGQYVDHFEVWPLDNPNDTVSQLTDDTATPVYALPASTQSFEIRLSFMSWPSKNFPDGKPILPGDISYCSTSLTWHNEVTPTQTAFPGAIIDPSDPNTVTLKFAEESDSNPYQKVLYLSNPVVMNAYIATIDGGTKKPGDEFGATLRLQTVSNSSSTIANDWMDPVVYVMPPAVTDLDTSLPIHFYSKTGVDLGEVTVEGPMDIAGYNGVYKLTLPAGTTIARRVDNFLDIKLTYVVKDGTPVGTYSLAGTGELSGGTYPATVGRIVPSSALPFDLPVAPWNMSKYPGPNVSATNGTGVSGYYFAADPNNIDNNTPYTSTSVDLVQLYDSPLSVFQVVRSTNLAPSAELRTSGVNPDDPSDDVWYNLTDPAAEQGATVPLTKTGQFELTLQNKGNTYVGDIRLLDILPYVGDARVLTAEGEISPAARNSQWQASLSDLAVTVRDAYGNDVTSQFKYTLNLSTQENPSYDQVGMSRAGDAAFTADTTDVSAARSFEFVLADRLPPGYTVELVATVKAPSNATTAQIGQSAYNSFAATGNYYDDAEGGTSTQAAGPFEPANQRLRLADGPIASFDDVVGAVYKDLNGDDTYEPGIDQPYQGVTVELVKPDPDNSGSYIPVLNENGEPRTTTTDENGHFTFDELYSGDYVFHIVIPDALAQTGAYTFDTPGDDRTVPTVLASAVPDAVDYSMVDADGYTLPVTIAPGAHVNGEVNAGIKATTTLTVQFEDEATHTVLSDYTVGPVSGTYHGDSASAYGHQDVTVTPGATRGGDGYTIPAGYHIVGEASQTATFEWNDTETVLSQTITFEVAKDIFTLSFNLNGADGTAPDDQMLPWGSTAAEPTAPVWADHTFLGWETADGAVWAFGNGGTPMPQNDVTLYAQWAGVPSLSWAAEGEQQTVLESRLQTGGTVVFTHTLTTDPGATVTGCTTTITTPTSFGAATAVATYGAMAVDGTYPVTVAFNATDADARSIAQYQISVVCTDTVEDPVAQTTNTVTDIVNVVYPEIALSVTGALANDAKHSAGDLILWTYTVTNKGTAGLAGVTIAEDPLLDGLSAFTCVDQADAAFDLAGGVLPPAGVLTCTATSKIQQADIDNTVALNHTGATGTATVGADSQEAASGDVLGLAPLPQDPKVTISKEGRVTDSNNNGKADVGEQIVFVITLENLGNVTVNQLKVDDTMTQLTLTCTNMTTGKSAENGQISLAPGQSVICKTSPYTITAADAANGSVVNLATYSGLVGNPPPAVRGGGNPGTITDETSQVTVQIAPQQQVPTGGWVAPAGWASWPAWLAAAGLLLAGGWLLWRRRQAGDAR